MARSRVEGVSRRPKTSKNKNQGANKQVSTKNRNEINDLEDLENEFQLQQDRPVEKLPQRTKRSQDQTVSRGTRRQDESGEETRGLTARNEEHPDVDAANMVSKDKEEPDAEDILLKVESQRIVASALTPIRYHCPSMDQSQIQHGQPIPVHQGGRQRREVI